MGKIENVVVALSIMLATVSSSAWGRTSESENAIARTSS
jgi:hypothetical protein